MSQVDSAIAFAATAHAGQVRKYDNLPYVTHPIHVMMILHKAGIRDDEMLVAAVLHDVVEDTPVGLTTIGRRFGEGVMDLVEELTDRYTAGTGGNRAARKAKERERLSRASARAQTIKYADLISNTASIVQHDLSFARTYLQEKELLLGAMRGGNSLILSMAEESLQSAQTKIMRMSLR
ncbi:MAG: HD domain-containing protein [Rhizorhabdus sp.]